MIALASALMMNISKYGFMDVAGIDGTSCDISRVAAGIITGIGILGGGLIFIGKQGYVSGITTAAGVWVTVGVGQVRCQVLIPARYSKEEIVNLFAGLDEVESFEIIQ